MDPTASGIVIAHHSYSRPQILLVKTRFGWGLPVGENAEEAPLLLERVQKTLFPPQISLELVTGPRKEFGSNLGPVTFELAIAAGYQIREYFDSEDWLDARWASFEEAFHIIQPDQEAPLKWCERGLRKTFEA